MNGDVVERGTATPSLPSGEGRGGALGMTNAHLEFLERPHV